jgi:hypothetical protein
MTKEAYLGDGLYASFDGWQIKLRAPRENGDHEVYLEPAVLKELMKFIEQLRVVTS